MLKGLRVLVVDDEDARAMVGDDGDSLIRNVRALSIERGGRPPAIATLAQKLILLIHRLIESLAFLQK